MTACTINGAFVAKAVFSSTGGESSAGVAAPARSRAQQIASSCRSSSSSSSSSSSATSCFFHLQGSKILKRSGYYSSGDLPWSAARRKSGTPVCTMASTVVSKQAKGRGNWNKSLSILKEFQSVCSTPAESLWSLVDEMIAEMEAGLAKEGGGKMRMLLTFVDNLPNGNETGIFYALDLGGTNFRVLRVQLGGKEGGVMRKESREAAIPPELMQGTNKELFDYIAKELADFACTSDENFCPRGKRLQLGFTFSFPIHQTSIKSGNLINWTKGFAVPDTVGKDVVKELEAAITRQGLEMRVSALVNDTVGTLARGHFVDEDVMISVILGTGTNACYVEDAAAIPKWHGRSRFMVINTEWGSSWSDNLPRADVDEALDAESINPGDQFFEKLVSGMYLGDILRRVLLKMATEAQLFGDEVPSKLLSPLSLTTPKMCAMHHDETSDLHEVGRILSESIGVDDTSLEVRQLVVEVCEAVAMRAARLAGAGIVGILKKIGRDGSTSGENGSVRSGAPRTVVAVDGGLYEKYPRFQEHLQKVVVEMLGEETAQQVSIELSQDGSGVGAALIAACCPSAPSL
ncbi:hexokinase-1 [Selaginella moellendorffii]|nr:hexokinase-1 [Selaginella moellendorffii]|eukprot:XP_002974995.2 hexokinase-1 [Selaginella moellendorffii]